MRCASFGQLISLLAMLPNESLKYDMYSFSKGSVEPQVDKKYETPCILQAYAIAITRTSLTVA